MSGMEYLRTQVAWACRILAMYNHADMTLGHVSARGADGLIYIKRKNLGLDEVTPEDVIGIDLEGNIGSGKGEKHLESVLHTEVYRVRADVGAITHSHPPYTTALGATNVDLAYVNHDALMFPEGLGRFDETAELITSVEMGKAVASALGTRKAVLMHNHGVLVVGKDVPWATYAALTLERAVMIQAIATSLGTVTPLSREAAVRVFQDKYRDDFTYAYWEYLIRKVRRAGLADGMPEHESP